jgi:hypothetical protein
MFAGITSISPTGNAASDYTELNQYSRLRKIRPQRCKCDIFRCISDNEGPHLMPYPVVPCVENMLNYLSVDNFLTIQ